MQREGQEDADRVGFGELRPGTPQGGEGFVEEPKVPQRAAVLQQAAAQRVTLQPGVYRLLVVAPGALLLAGGVVGPAHLVEDNRVAGMVCQQLAEVVDGRLHVVPVAVPEAFPDGGVEFRSLEGSHGPFLADGGPIAVGTRGGGQLSGSRRHPRAARRPGLPRGTASNRAATRRRR